MRILGIDPGLAAGGYGVLDVDGGGVMAVRICGIWESERADGPNEARLGEIHRAVSALLDEYEPHAVVLELPAGSKSAMAAAAMWGAYGTVMGLCRGRALLVQRRAGEWREILGLPKRPRGDAGEKLRKADVRAAMQARFPGLGVLLPLVKHSHAYDALALACSWVDVAGGARSAQPCPTTRRTRP